MIFRLYLTICFSDEISETTEWRSKPGCVTLERGLLYSRGGAADNSNNTDEEEEEESMVDVAIQIAAVVNIILEPNIATGKGKGECLFEASLSQFDTRPKLGQLLTYETQAWRDFTVDTIEANECAFNLYSIQESGEIGSKFKQWKRDLCQLRQPGQFKCTAGDLMPLGLAARLARNLLVINTNAKHYNDVITVHLAATLGGQAMDNCPILLCYDGNHYEGLCPKTDEDERKVIDWTCNAYIKRVVFELESGAQRVILPDLKNFTTLVEETIDGDIPDLLHVLRVRLFSNLQKHMTGSYLGQMKKDFSNLSPQEQQKTLVETQNKMFYNHFLPEVGQSKRAQNTSDAAHLRLLNDSGRNHCFANSTVQYIGAVPELRNFLMTKVPIEPLQEAIATVQELARIFKSNAPEESTELFRQLVSQRSGMDLASGRQEDVDEFLRASLSVINLELGDNNEYQDIRSTFWGKISFTTRFENTLPVGNCSKCPDYQPETREEDFFALMLTVPYSASPINLSTQLSAFFRGNIFWRSCPDCCKCHPPCHEIGPCRQLARCQRSIITAPNTLCIQLTRFARGRDALKVQTVVEAPHNLQLMGFIDYNLVATMDHKGSTIQSGHYVSKVRDPDGSWKLYDDTRVSTISHWGVVSKDNYFLMYRRESSANTREAPILELTPDEILQVWRGLF